MLYLSFISEKIPYLSIFRHVISVLLKSLANKLLRTTSLFCDAVCPLVVKQRHVLRGLTKTHLTFSLKWEVLRHIQAVINQHFPNTCFTPEKLKKNKKDPEIDSIQAEMTMQGTGDGVRLGLEVRWGWAAFTGSHYESWSWEASQTSTKVT